MIQAALRLDSGNSFGLGHMMRSKALADALLKIDIKCTFFVRKVHPDCSVIPHNIVYIDDEAEFITLAKKYDVIVVDHYDYTSELFFQLSKIKQSILVILDDECNRGDLYADIIVNPVKEAISLPYNNVSPSAKLLIGTQYAILGKSFQKLKFPLFEKRDLIIVMFGGSDIGELTLPVLKTVKNTSLLNYRVVAVTGPGCKHVDEIREYCEKTGFEHQHDVKNMARLFLNTRLAISAAGSTVFELACSGVPSVFAVVADNQFLSVMSQSKLGWCEVVDCRIMNQEKELVRKADNMLVSESLENKSRIAQSQIDGKGAERVASKISEYMILKNK